MSLDIDKDSLIQTLVDGGLSNSSSGYSNGRLVDFLYENPSFADLASLERLCKIRNDKYVVCPGYCCGEFWESSPRFCCQNNFKPIRNLFYFLLTAFVALFATIVIYLSVESAINVGVSKRCKALEDLHPKIIPNNKSTLTRDLKSSGETSLDEDSSSQRTRSDSNHIPPKQFLIKHSQSFKNMSRLNSMRRLVRKSYEQTLKSPSLS